MKTLREMIRPCLAAGCMALSLALSGCGGGSGGDAPTPDAGPPATVTAPSISTAPAAASVVDGQRAIFSVTAAGTGPFTYQWQRNGVNIAGATSAIYELPTVSAADAGATFQVVVSNSAGGITSAAATLTVTAVLTAPSIVSQPISTTVVPGSPARFEVVANGTAPLTYQWQRNGADIAGATTASYNLAATTTGDNGASFRVVATNAAGSQTSAAVTLTLDQTVAAPTIAVQPQSLSIPDGVPAVLSVQASGTGPFSYQWRKNGTNIAGATDSIYITQALVPADTSGIYSVAISNGAGSVTSANATITVTLLPVEILATPQASTVVAGNPAVFIVLAPGSQPVTFQWRRNGVAIPGATAPSYFTPATTPADDGSLYSVVVTNPVNSVTSAAVRLTVTGAPVAPAIATPPASVTVNERQTATFAATATGSAPLSYQWLRNGVAITGATSSNYTTAATTLTDNAARFAVRVSNSAGNVTTAEAVLTVRAASGGLVGRAWSAGQSLESNDQSVLSSAVDIDDAGNAISVFIKSDGTRNVLYATRGVPGAAGTAVTWSAPVAIDTAALPSTTPRSTIETPVLTVAPNGNAIVTWGSTSACTAVTYSTNLTARCNILVSAKYDAGTNAWSAPVAVADTPRFAPAIQQVINNRGDVALLYPGWVRSGASGFTTRVAVAWQVKGQTALRARVFDDATLNLQTLGMDKDSNLLVAGSANQNATSDVVVYRGTMAGGFGAQEVLDQRAAAATFQMAAVGVNGQAVVVWTQNNGTVDTRYTADIGTPSGAWSVKEMEPRSNGRAFPRQALTVTDNGDALYAEHSNGSCSPYFHRLSGGSWSALTRFPSGFAGCNWSTTFNRNGDALQFSGSAWQTYEAATNTMVRLNSNSATSVYGTTGGSTGTSSFALSTNGTGVLTVAVPFDALPTVAQPAGDGRRAVTNLWGLFLK